MIPSDRQATPLKARGVIWNASFLKPPSNSFLKEESVHSQPMKDFWPLFFTSCIKNKSFILCNLLTAMLQSRPLAFQTGNAPRISGHQRLKESKNCSIVSTSRWPVVKQAYPVTCRLRRTCIRMVSFLSPIILHGQLGDKIFKISPLRRFRFLEEPQGLRG